MDQNYPVHNRASMILVMAVTDVYHVCWFKVFKISYYSVSSHSSAPVGLITLSLKFSTMVKRSNIDKGPGARPLLKTDFPLCEKDEQAQSMERMRKLQTEALKLWRSLKKNINEKAACTHRF